MVCMEKIEAKKFATIFTQSFRYIWSCVHFTIRNAYNGPVVHIPKVPRAEFEAVIKSLLNTPPMPANAITDKRPRKEGAKRPGPQKRG
jgi:hypothetical protein